VEQVDWKLQLQNKIRNIEDREAHRTAMWLRDQQRGAGRLETPATE
jgi:hypothetical protein